MIQNSPSGGAINRSSLNATVGRMAAIATALLLVAFLVLSVSRAAFTATTANENNFVKTGVVTLTDNDVDSALFELDNTDALPLNDIVPGVPVVKCISVDYAGNFNSDPIQMYAIASAGAPVSGDIGALDEYLDVKVERIVSTGIALATAPNALHTCLGFDAAVLANGPSSTVYNSTLDAFPSSYNASGTPAGNEISHTATAPNTQTFRISVTVRDTAGAANARADWNFVWETRSA